MTSEELGSLEAYIKHIVPEKSVCVVQIPEDQLEVCAKSLEYLNQTTLSLYSILFVACPLNAKLTVIPPHSEVSLGNV